MVVVMDSGGRGDLKHFWAEIDMVEGIQTEVVKGSGCGECW